MYRWGRRRILPTYFYVDKTSGKTKMVEFVPGLEIKSEAGTIDLFDYMK